MLSLLSLYLAGFHVFTSTGHHVFYSSANILRFLTRCPLITAAEETTSLSSIQWAPSTPTPDY